MPEISHPIPPLNIDAKAAGERVNAWYQAERSKRRRIPPTSRYIDQAAQQHQVQIFNVGPWRQEAQMGSLGTYFIPAYDPENDPQKRGYALMIMPIPGVVTEFYPEDATSMRQIIDDGDYVAEQILGIGPMHSPRNSLLRFGCGYFKGEKPSDEQLDSARFRLLEYAQELFEEAELAAAQGPRELQLMRTERHTWAARHIGRADVAWMVQTQTSARQRCDVCGTYSEPGVMMCPNHTNMPWVFDQKRYDDFMRKLKKQQSQ